MPDKCPGVREWARLELTEPLSVTSSQFACQFIHSGFLSATAQVASSFFFTWGWGRGGKSYTALSQKQPCFRARSHESGYFWDCMSFFTPIDLSSTRNQWARSPKPETRNPKPASFQNRSSECPKTPSTRIRVKNVRFQLGFNPVSNKPIPDRKCCIPRNDHRIDFATYFHLL